MATSIEPALLALAGTVVGGLISFTATAWTERRRLADTRAFRNYTERVRAATEYLTTFDNYRRCIRDGRGRECYEFARAHSSAIVLLELFFDQSIRQAAEEARSCLIRMNDNPSERRSLDREAQAARAKVIEMFREPLGVTEPATSGQSGMGPQLSPRPCVSVTSVCRSRRGADAGQPGTVAGRWMTSLSNYQSYPRRRTYQWSRLGHRAAVEHLAPAGACSSRPLPEARKRR